MAPAADNILQSTNEGDMGENKFESLAIDGWELVKFEGEDEPRILDTDLGQRLEYGRERNIRKMIKKLHEDGKLPGVLRALRRERTQMPTGGVRETEVEAYYLDERNALRVIRHCDTEKADSVMEEVISVYLKVKRAAQVIGVTPMQLAEALEPLVLKLKENGIALDRLAATNSDTCLRVMRLEAAQVGPGIINKHQREHIKTTIDKIASMRAIVERSSHQSSRMRVENELRNAINFPRTIGGAWRYLPLNRLGDTNSMLARMEKEAEKRLRYHRIMNNDTRQTELF